MYKHLARKVPYVPGGGLSLCDVRDVAEAHCRAMETPAADGGAFCLGGRPDANMTLKAFFDLLEQLSGVPRTRLEAPPPPRALLPPSACPPSACPPARAGSCPTVREAWCGA